MLVTYLSPHFGAPTRPSTLEVLRVRECTPIPYPFVVFTFGLIIEYVKEFGGESFAQNVASNRGMYLLLNAKVSTLLKNEV